MIWNHSFVNQSKVVLDYKNNSIEMHFLLIFCGKKINPVRTAQDYMFIQPLEDMEIFTKRAIIFAIQ